jgi:hypothetical protein
MVPQIQDDFLLQLKQIITGEICITRNPYLNTSKFNMTKIESNTNQSVALNTLESKLMRFKGGISACNLFQSENKEASIANIKERFQQIVISNPWLKGSCSKGKKGQVYLNFDNSDTDSSPLIHSGQAPSSLNEYSNYTDVLNSCEAYIVEKAFKLYKKKDRLSKLVILHLDENRLLLMFSLSHLIGDGFTFYEIFNMLSNNNEVVSLNVIRKSEIDRVSDIIPKENSNFLFNPRMIFWAIGRAFSRKRMLIKSFELNESYIENMKQKAKDKGIVDFISTNDILSSCYAQLCDSNALIMAINFRDRIPSISKMDAGNYEDLLVINKENTRNSEILRSLINDLANQARKINLPKGSAMAKSNPVLITNWAGFSQTLEVKHAKELIHMPLYTSREITFDSCIVYKPKSGVVSALLFMKDLDENKVRSHPLFQKP